MTEELEVLDTIAVIDAVDSLEKDIRRKSMEHFLRDQGLWPDYCFFEFRVWTGISKLAKWADSLREGTHPQEVV